MRSSLIRTLLGTFLLVGCSLLPVIVQSAEKPDSGIKCQMDFTLSSWSVLYKTGSGKGTVACDNGQSRDVTIKTHGGGVTFGKSKIVNGHGTFSKVQRMDELFGSYATSEAHAGAVGSADALAMTKGEVSLALSGTGKGFDLGVDFGQFKITPAPAR
jgi:hypothetical protein